jgi:hypothetical protein
MPFQQAPKFWLYSHNFTHTGAPLVLGAIARELAEQGWRRRLRLLSWGGHHDRVHTKLRRELEAEGFHCRVLNPEQAAPKPKPNDRILLNSLALPEAVIKTALAWLECSEIKRLDWYGHEGNPSQLLGDKQWPQRLLPLLSTGKLQMRVPSIHTLGSYQNWLEYSGSNLAVQTPLLPLKNSGCSLFDQPLPTFNSLRLQLTGMAGDGNKGHLWLLRLLQAVIQSGAGQNQNQRPLELHFNGLETDSGASLARELRLWGHALLGDRFNSTPHGSRNQILTAMANANLAVSCSRIETYSLVAMEAMAMGQPLLRNRTGGWQEQLKPDVTGFDLGETEYHLRKEQVQLLQRLLDPQLTPSWQLSAISLKARQHAQSISQGRYANWLLA